MRGDSSYKTGAEQHIQQLFEERGRDDPNSTTLANTLDKDIETAFNSPEKFLFELLQNADDASIDAEGVDVEFRLRQGYLQFSHTGKAFDRNDVEAICDNAQQRIHGKQCNLEKTGYKGIGFKSVFVVSDVVYILSADYVFRFDRNYAQWKTARPDRRYPWQIIPIWTESALLPKEATSEKPVTFLFHLRESIDIQAALKILLKTPQVILFLRRVRSIVIDQNDCKTCIELKRFDHENSYVTLYINKKEIYRWCLTVFPVKLTDVIRKKLQNMGSHECPEKLKATEKVSIKYAFPVGKDGRLQPCKDQPFFSYLPTMVQTGLPFLVNADFLLSADRMQLLSNDWNIFLLKKIGAGLILSLQYLAKIPDYRYDVLQFYQATLIAMISSEFAHAYRQGLEGQLKKIPFIPQAKIPENLLLFNEAIADNTGFYNQFPEVDAEIFSHLAHPESIGLSRLPKQWYWSDFLKKLPGYASSNKNISFHRALLDFLISHHHKSVEINTGYFQRPSSASVLLSVAFLLTDQLSIVNPKQIDLPTSTDAVRYPDFLERNYLHPKLIELPGLIDWLKMVGAQPCTSEKLFELLVDFVEKNQLSITANQSLEILQLLYAMPSSFNKQLYQLKQLPVETTEGELKSVSQCYLPSSLSPEVDLQSMAKDGAHFINNRYIDSIEDLQKLKQTFLGMGVTDRIAFIMLTQNAWSESNAIIEYDSYINHLRSVDKVSFFGGQYSFPIAYLPFLSCLPQPGYAEFFWRQLALHQDLLIEQLSNFAVTVRSKTRQESYPATHYLRFVLSNSRLIKATDDQCYPLNALYLPEFVERFGKRLARFLPRPAFNFRQCGLSFSGLLKQLGIKDQLMAGDVIRLFSFISETASDYRQTEIAALYHAVITAIYNDAERKSIQNANLRLLAMDGSFQLASDLSYVTDLTADLKPNPYLLKQLPGINAHAMSLICQFFGVKKVETNVFEIVVKPSQSNLSFHSTLKNLLPYAALVYQAESKMNASPYLRWSSLLSTLRLQPATEISLHSGVFLGVICARALLHSETLYHLSDVPRCFERLLTMFFRQLGLSQACLDQIIRLSLLETDVDRVEWMEEQGYDVQALMSLECDDISENEISFSTAAHQIDKPVTPPLHSPQIDSATPPDAIDYDAITVEKRTNFPRVQTPINNQLINNRQVQRSESNISVQQSKPSQEELSEPNLPSRDQWSGAWGEEFIFHYLKNHYLKKYPKADYQENDSGFNLRQNLDKQEIFFLTVIWYNKVSESGGPVDFDVIKNGEKRSIEVKSTYKNSQMLLRISRNEWQTMRAMGNRYRLFCVYNAGQQKNVRVHKIKDPAKEIFENKLPPYEVQLKL